MNSGGERACRPTRASSGDRGHGSGAAFNVYSTKELGRELRQAEIISDLVQFVPNGKRDEQDRVLGEFIAHPFAIVVTQDCDLLRDFDKRADGGDGVLASVLFFAAQSAQEVHADIKGRDIWKRVRQNNDERYHLLEAIAPDCDLARSGIHSLVVDFRYFFTLTPADIYNQCNTGAAKEALPLGRAISRASSVQSCILFSARDAPCSA